MFYLTVISVVNVYKDYGTGDNRVVCVCVCVCVYMLCIKYIRQLEVHFFLLQ